MEAIIKYRERHGMARGELGKLIGVTAEFVRLVEKGKRKLSPERALDLEVATDGELPRTVTRPDLWEPKAA